jgi:hypothetical protein
MTPTQRKARWVGHAASGYVMRRMGRPPEMKVEADMFHWATMVILLSGLTARAALPPVAAGCVAANPEVTVNRLQKPSYLKVFFTESYKPDYIIAVRERGSSLNRALVCMHDGKAFVLGAKANERPFSDMKNDNYMSSRWRVCGKKDVADLRKYYQGVPEPANDAVCLLWEDAEALIYSDGHNLRWKSLEP